MPAPKGNQYALGCTTSGQPRKYKSPEQLQEAINAYFESCFDTIKETTGRGKTEKTIEKRVQVKFYTVAGLALALGITTESLRNYEKKKGYEEYSFIVLRAKQIIEEDVEQKLYSKTSATGAIFNLKCNYGYVDRQVIDTNHSGEIKQIHETDTENHEEIMKITNQYEEELFKRLSKKK